MPASACHGCVFTTLQMAHVIGIQTVSNMQEVGQQGWSESWLCSIGGLDGHFGIFDEELSALVDSVNWAVDRVAVCPF